MANTKGYYRIIIGTGFYWCDSYVIETERPTTDYGALTDMLIDYMVEKKDYRILDMDNKYEWDNDFETLHEKENPDWIYYPDTFVQGGNCGNVLMHYGEFRIEEISENEINEDDEIIYEEDI